MTEVSLRKATVEDLTFVAACAEIAYQIYVDRIGKKPAPMVADFAAALRAQQLEILVVDDQPIGFLVSYEKAQCLFVENVAIAPEHQGKGYGGAIFDALERRASVGGLAAIELYTNEKMSENLKFYSRLGFTEFDRRSESGFNRIYFRKELG